MGPRGMYGFAAEVWRAVLTPGDVLKGLRYHQVIVPYPWMILFLLNIVESLPYYDIYLPTLDGPALPPAPPIDRLWCPSFLLSLPVCALESWLKCILRVAQPSRAYSHPAYLGFQGS